MPPAFARRAGRSSVVGISFRMPASIHAGLELRHDRLGAVSGLAQANPVHAVDLDPQGTDVPSVAAHIALAARNPSTRNFSQIISDLERISKTGVREFDPLRRRQISSKTHQFRPSPAVPWSRLARLGPSSAVRRRAVLLSPCWRASCLSLCLKSAPVGIEGLHGGL